MQREAVVYEDEGVRLTPSTSGPRGAFPLFGMVANQENVDPVSGLLTAASRPANSPLTPGAIAAAARAAALLPELPAAGPAAEDPKAGDGSGATQAIRRMPLANITQYMEKPEREKDAGRQRAFSVLAVDDGYAALAADGVAAAAVPAQRRNEGLKLRSFR